MQNRVTLVSALAAIVPVLLVLIAIAVLVRPATSPTESDAIPAKLAPTSAGAGQSSAVQPTVVPATKPRPSGPAAPGFDGGGAWINSEPLDLAELGAQGKIVLIDFWTFGCYNCRNTLPYVKQWWAKYKDQGLVIVGVHTPEFDSERVLENVQEAVQREEIGWPVVQDNDYTIWRAYGNHYWPRFYLVDERGQIIYDHIGEGAYEQTEAQIAAALAARNQ
ncbi:MAG TPA: redoxin domain-containing protein [Roseiflexaceae bacterium]|nr:redoxin domain-containing protein [Roseiflexaceae bacterium]